RIALVDLRTRTAEAWAMLHDDVYQEITDALRSLAELDVLRTDQVERIANRIQLIPKQQAAGALAAAELVIECVPEAMEAKRDAFDWLNRYCSETAILTSTTSSILVTDLAALVQKPERFLNTHWLNPAYVVPLVELSFHLDTSDEVLARTQ